MINSIYDAFMQIAQIDDDYYAQAEEAFLAQTAVQNPAQPRQTAEIQRAGRDNLAALRKLRQLQTELQKSDYWSGRDHG